MSSPLPAYLCKFLVCHLVSEAHLTADFKTPHPFPSQPPQPPHPALGFLCVPYRNMQGNLLIYCFVVCLLLALPEGRISVTFEPWCSYLAPRGRLEQAAGETDSEFVGGSGKRAVGPAPSGAPTHLCPMLPAR